MNLLPDPPTAREDLPFTNRDEHLEDFVEALETKEPDSHRVLVYHGVGGIGKSRLSNELGLLLDGKSQRADSRGLSERVEAGRLPWGRMSFENPRLRSGPDALFRMQREIKAAHGLRFPTFLLAFAIWYGKVFPTTPLKESKIPFLEEADFLLSALEIAEEIPGISLVAKLPRLLQRMGEAYQEAVLKTDHESLQALQGKEAFMIERELPTFWAEDLKRQRGTQETQAVLFLDGYEGLWSEDRSETRFHRTDEWVRTWVEALPGVLWVVTGREELFWDEKKAGGEKWASRVLARQVEELEPGFTREMLDAAGIHDRTVQDAIIETTGGNPFDVNLAIDFANEQTEAGESLDPVQFEGTRFELYERFFLYLGENRADRYLGDEELPALELLAVPRQWDFSLYSKLATEFGHRSEKILFKRLLRFSFVDEQGDGTYKLHDRAREALQEHVFTFDKAETIHAFLFKHYRGQFKDVAVRDLGPEHDAALEEAFYHAARFMDVSALADWFHGAQRPFENAAHYFAVEQLYIDLLERQENEDASEVGIATTLNNLAVLYKAQGRYGGAELLFKRAFLISSEQSGGENLKMASTLNNLAVVYGATGRYAEAEPLYERALKIREKHLGAEHPSVATTLNNLAWLYKAQGRYGEAESLYEQALAIREEQLGPVHPRVATTVGNLAGLYYTQGRYENVKSMYKRALQVLEEGLGAEHPNVASMLNNLASVYEVQGAYAVAESLNGRALEIQEEQLGAEHPSVANTLDRLASVYKLQGRYAEAEPLYERALKIEEQLGAEHPDVATTLNNLATLYESQGRYGEAEPLYEQALKIDEEQLGRSHPNVATTLNNLAGLYKAQGRYGEAESLYEQALAIREEQLGAEHPDVATTLNNLAGLYELQGRYGEAEPLYEQALKIVEEQLGRSHPNVATTLNNLAGLYKAQGRYGEAESLYEQALAIREEQLGAEHPSVATTLSNLAGLYYAQGRCSEAEDYFERAIDILEASVGPDHPNTKQFKKNLEICRQTCEER